MNLYSPKSKLWRVKAVVRKTNGSMVQLNYDVLCSTFQYAYTSLMQRIRDMGGILTQHSLTEVEESALTGTGRASNLPVVVQGAEKREEKKPSKEVDPSEGFPLKYFTRHTPDKFPSAITLKEAKELK